MEEREIKEGMRFNALLHGKIIHGVRWMTKGERDMMGWYSRPMVIMFTDGSLMYFQSDDEGNDGGAAIYQVDSKEHILYTR